MRVIAVTLDHLARFRRVFLNFELCHTRQKLRPSERIAAMDFLNSWLFMGIMIVALIGLIAFYFIQKNKQNDD